MVNTDLINIDDLIISQRVKNVLHNANINTVTDLLLTKAKLKGIGYKALSEIKAALRKYNLHLYDSVRTARPDDNPEKLTIDDVELSVRSHRALYRARILSIKELCSMTENDLRNNPYTCRAASDIIFDISNLGFTLRSEDKNNGEEITTHISEETRINARCWIIESFHTPRVAIQWHVNDYIRILGYSNAKSCISDLVANHFLTATKDYMYTISEYPIAILELVLKTNNIPLRKTKKSMVKDITNNLSIDEITPVIPEFAETRYIWTEKGIKYCQENAIDKDLLHRLETWKAINYDKYVLLKY